MLNGMMRFPLVLTYCFQGSPSAPHCPEPDSLNSLMEDGAPNLAVPILCSCPSGLVIVALFGGHVLADSTSGFLSDLHEGSLRALPRQGTAEREEHSGSPDSSRSSGES